MRYRTRREARQITQTSAPLPRWLPVVLSLVCFVLVGGGCVNRWLFERLPTPLLPPSAPPAGVGSLSAAACGGCHSAIFAEWSQTRMAKAMVDPIFQTDWQSTGKLYACLYCHAPLAEQRPDIITHLASLRPLEGGGTVNPTFDAALQLEGVTCVACHLRDGALVGPIPDVQAPHPIRVDPDFAGAAACVGCHQVPEPPLSDLNRPIADTHGEWEAWKAATGRTESCVACHMPAVERPIASGGPVRLGRSHLWHGAWDEATVRAGLDIAILPDASVVLTNRAGHNFPTADPARALSVTVTFFAGTLSSGTHALRSETAWIERKVKLPRLVDQGDTTLLPAEVRTIRFDPAGASSARIVVTFDRLKGLPHTRASATEPVTLVLLDETIALSEGG